MKFSRVLAEINKDYKKKIVNRDKDLEVSISKVRGKEFYEILSLVTNDFDKDCERALSNVAEVAKKKFIAKKEQKEEKEKKVALTKANKPKNKYQKFINQFVFLQSDVAEKAYIENTRFSKVLRLNANDFYAYEVYLIAESQGISFKSGFEQLYGSKDEVDVEEGEVEKGGDEDIENRGEGEEGEK